MRKDFMSFQSLEQLTQFFVITIHYDTRFYHPLRTCLYSMINSTQCTRKCSTMIQSAVDRVLRNSLFRRVLQYSNDGIHFLENLQAKLVNLVKRGVQRRCFPLNFKIIFRKDSLQNKIEPPETTRKLCLSIKFLHQEIR